MGSGSVSFCGMSMDWNDVLADYEGTLCVCLSVFDLKVQWDKMDYFVLWSFSVI